MRGSSDRMIPTASERRARDKNEPRVRIAHQGRGIMAKATRLTSMSIDALLKPRDDIGKILTQKAGSLRDQLSRLGGEASKEKRGRRGPLAGRKAPIKFRDKSGNTWAGRGAQPIWLREELKAGAKLDDFAVKSGVTKKCKRRINNPSLNRPGFRSRRSKNPAADSLFALSRQRAGDEERGRLFEGSACGSH